MAQPARKVFVALSALVVLTLPTSSLPVAHADTTGGDVLFVSDRDCPPNGLLWCSWKLYRKDSDGVVHDLSGAHNTDFTPSVSPDGSLVAFASWPGRESQIFLMNTDGTGRVPLTNQPEGWDESPSWSPDGDKIVFTRWTYPYDGPWEHGRVLVLERNAAGVWEERLLFDRRGSETSVKFSPDGNKILYAFDPDDDGIEEEGESWRKDLWVFDLTTQKHTRLTRTRRFSEESPDWAPNGRRIVFSLGRDPFPHVGRHLIGLHTIRSDGSDRQRLISDVGRLFMFPEWTEDGSTIGFQNCPRPGDITFFYSLDCGVATLDIRSRKLMTIENEEGSFEGQPEWIP